jgi:RNA polymerase sigma-70 factor (ECF subfamily)
MTETVDQLSAALEAAIARFGTLVRSIGGRHGLVDADVDEVMQEVRIRLWRAHRSAEALRAMPVSYVYKTASSAALDILRRRRAYHAARTAPLELVEEPLVDLRRPDADLAGRELAERVAAAVEGITESRRAVVRMHLRGYSRDEMAELLGWSEPRTRNLLYRGLAELRERLAAQGISATEVRDD